MRCTPTVSLVALATVVTLNLAPAPAHAQSAHPAATDTSARELFNQGVALLQDGRYADAIATLERARALREVPAVVYNLALAQRGAGRYVDVIANLQRYVELAGSRLDAAGRTEVDNLLREARAAVIHVTVHVQGNDAHVTLDEQPVTPEQLAQPMTLDPGRHTFRATAEGMRPAEVSRDFAQGETAEIALAPEAREATLHVDSDQPAAEIYVDRHRVASGSFDTALPPGAHEVEIRAAGFATYHTNVTLMGGRAERVHVVLVREGGGLLTRWWFWGGAVVVLGGIAAGVAGGVIAGSHTESALPGSLGYVVQAEERR